MRDQRTFKMGDKVRIVSPSEPEYDGLTGTVDDGDMTSSTGERFAYVVFDNGDEDSVPYGKLEPITKESKMKKLNITKEQFNKSRYFKNKYGTLKYVSESGKIFKTSKGRVLKFNESESYAFDDSKDQRWYPGLPLSEIQEFVKGKDPNLLFNMYTDGDGYDWFAITDQDETTIIDELRLAF